MRVLVAGATGVIGRPLVGRLLEGGHEVIGTTRSSDRANGLRELGVTPVVLDARDTAALRSAVIEARPGGRRQPAHQPAQQDRTSAGPRRRSAPTNELRGTVGPALAGAAAEAGARRLIAQSVCFFYASTGQARARRGRSPARASARRSGGSGPGRALESLERSAVETPGLEGVVLRYGYFYGPEVEMVPGGFDGNDVRKRRAAIVGEGTGIFSLVHVDDAAAATIAALDRGSGIYNICDDEPAATGGVAAGLRGGDRGQATAPRPRVAGEAGRREAGGRDWPSGSRAPRTRRPSASSAGSRSTRAGARASARRWASRSIRATIAVPIAEDRRQQPAAGEHEEDVAVVPASPRVRS